MRPPTLGGWLCRNSTVIGLSLCLVLIATATWLIGDKVLSRTVTEALLRVVLVVGLYIFVGNSGILSFGHIGFSAIAAYAVAWQTCSPAAKAIYMPGLPDFLLDVTVPLLPAALAAALLAALVALAIGTVLMRLSGLAASIGTFCFLAIIHSTYENWQSVTSGTGSIVGVPVYVTPFVALAWALVAIAVAQGYRLSRFGLALQSSREDETAAKAYGIDVTRERLLAFVISAFFAGMAGVLHAHFFGILSVNAFYLSMTFTTLAMLVVGGMRSLTGAVVGVIGISAVIAVLRHLEAGAEIGALAVSIPRGAQEIALGVLMLLVLILRPGGIMGGHELTWPFSPRLGAPARERAYPCRSR